MAKSTLEKYYISEKFDKERNISFNFKKANVKISGNFPNFLDAVLEFINVSEKTKNNTRVWFHRDGAYRGSVDVTKAKAIVASLQKSNVKNEDAINFIEEQNLVDKPAPKPAKKETPKTEAKPKASNDLPKSVFGLEKVYSQAIFDAILAERGAKRLATHKIKSRAEVSGTGKKPWRQKGTGNARAGSLRSPIFVGGGRAFGPTVERNYNLKINKKARRNALFSALTMLANDNSVLVKEYKLEKPSTKELLVRLNEDKLVGLRNILIITNDETVYLSARNIPSVNVNKVSSLSIEALVAADVLVISKSDIEYLEGLAK